MHPARPALLLAALFAAAAAPLPSRFTGTDCAGRSARACTGPQGNVLSVRQAGPERTLLIDGHAVLSAQGTIGQRAEWHLLGGQLTGLIVPVHLPNETVYAVMRLAGPDAQTTCMVASSKQGGPARQLAARAQDMSCVPAGATEIVPGMP